jgi:FMN phosphatase YigB (HAD superfamily)
MPSKKRIGIDFDNTLIDYDAVFRALAREWGLIDPGFRGAKEDVRRAVRALPDGEEAWQRLQGAVYGSRIGGAVLFEGADTFLRRARADGHDILIVSHKTEYGHFDPARINLREAALEWMQQKGFFSVEGFGLPIDNVRFAATRAEKIAHIAELGFTHFIDDLPEVLDDAAFPADVTKILFTNGARAPNSRACAFAHWRDIARAVLT